MDNSNTGKAGKSQRWASGRGVHRRGRSTDRDEDRDDAQADPWSDDLSPASCANVRGRRGGERGGEEGERRSRRARRESQHLGDEHAEHEGAGHMRQRLEELATLRALRRTFEAQRRSGASQSQHEAPEPVRAAVSLQHRRLDGQSRSSPGGKASEARSGREEGEELPANERSAARVGGAHSQAHLGEEEANTGRLVGQPAVPMRHVGDSDSHGEGSNILDHGTSHETTLGQAQDAVEGWGDTRY